MSKNESCMFCGFQADTREHVIPQWMHKKFGIKHDKLMIRNDTEVKYIHQVMPACAKCNGNRFSPIEERVKNGSASSQDLYVWALKIYVGLNLKDTQLLEDRRTPSKGTVLTEEESIKGIEFSKEILKNYGCVNFSLFPMPFGSVFINELPTNFESTFALASIGYPYNIITVILDDRKLLTVILNDKGVVSNAIVNGLFSSERLFENLSEKLANNGMPLTANMYAQMLTFIYAKLKCRLDIPKGFLCSKKRVEALRVRNKIKLIECDDFAVAKDLAYKLFRIDL
ncbi:hypothetical protein [Aeromonas veronii]|uniref:hypothetical protein n=1 Tax=Aeromonas veronii TaxID=654 RepID=UPI0011169C12|nr:hypothetical protein [Aeromonas veronii]